MSNPRADREKHAFLVGINYIGTKSQLHGCINDCNSVKELLLKRGFQERNITLINDHTPIKPTKVNILNHLQLLCSRPNSELFFHYSGHGSQTRDRNGEEDDGMDECLIPLDYHSAGTIVDDQIREIVGRVPESSAVTILCDSCHAGSIADLAYNIVQYKGKYEFARNNRYPETAANVMLLSGCQDQQVSIDANFENKHYGAMTYCFLFAMEKGGVKTWSELYAKIVKLLGMFRFKQIPHLSSGKNISCDSLIFGL